MGAPVPLGALGVSQGNRRVGSPFVTPVRRGWGRDSCPVASHHGRCGPAVPPPIGPSGLLEGVPWRGVAGAEVLRWWGLPQPEAGGRSGGGAGRPSPVGVATCWAPWLRVGLALRCRPPTVLVDRHRGPCMGIHPCVHTLGLRLAARGTYPGQKNACMLACLHACRHAWAGVGEGNS